MQGLGGIAEELNRLLEPLSAKDLAQIVDVAFDVTLNDDRHAPDICGAIEAYRADQGAARARAGSLSELSEKCDAEYMDAEDLGQVEKSANKFRKMCTLNGLTLLLSALSLPPEVVDRFIDDLGHGATDTDLFAARMIEKFR